MLWIAVTSPEISDGEAGFIKRLLAHGVDIVHLRKPGASEKDCARLLDALTAEERSRIVVHDFFSLAGQYGLRGIHLNSRHGQIPEGYDGHVSRSCHSLEEVKLYKPECTYVFLSPIFDSISKQGYASAFDEDTLRKAGKDGIIDSKVVALGGVTPDRTALLRSIGFGGAAMLGCVYGLASLPGKDQTAALMKMKAAIKSPDPGQDC